MKKPLYYYLPKRIKERIEALKLLFVQRLHDRSPKKYCWADCVSWSMSRRLKWWKIEKACSHISENPCYCGAWHKGKHWDDFTPEEQRQMRGEPIEGDVLAASN